MTLFNQVNLTVDETAGSHVMNDRAALHREMDALITSLVDETCRTAEIRRPSDRASGALSWLPILCIGGACLNLLGGMAALLVAVR